MKFTVNLQFHSRGLPWLVFIVGHLLVMPRKELQLYGIRLLDKEKKWAFGGFPSPTQF